MNANRLCVPVDVCSPLYGDCTAILRDIDSRRCLVDMCYMPPLGAALVVRFTNAQSSPRPATIEARAIVMGPRFTGPGLENASTRLVELRFVDFVDGDRATPVA